MTNLAANNDLGVYIHWPYCNKICPYCDFNVYRLRQKDTSPLYEAILLELKNWAQNTKNRKLKSLYFGGGTPSLMSQNQIKNIIDFCKNNWGFTADFEIALEANPEDFENFAQITAAGIERLSLGVQSFELAGLKALGRFHDVKTSKNAIKMAQRTFERVSIDLIYGWPNQTIESWRQELQTAIEMGVEHISAYQLTIEPNTSFEKKFKRGQLQIPDNELSFEFFEATQNHLNSAGFDSYEISNHAKNKMAQSKHNLLYWQSMDWIGIGPGAHGRIGNINNRREIINIYNPEKYILAVNSGGFGCEIDNILPPSEAIIEYFIMGLRLENGIEFKQFANSLNQGQISKHIETGMLEINNQFLKITPLGRALSNKIIEDILI